MLYEDLVSNPVKALDEVLEQIGADPFEFSHIDSDGLFAKCATSICPEQSIGRWRFDIGAVEARAIEKAAGATMVRWGFQRHHP